MITFDRVHQLLDYDPETGHLIWRQDGYRRARRKVGQRAGSISNITGSKRQCSIRQINVDYKVYKEHRIIWLWMTGSFPEKGLEVDHINRDSTDNRWSNLRLVSKSQNSLNRNKPRGQYTSKYIGVYYRNHGRGSKRWVAKCKDKFIGTYLTEQEAHEAYEKYKKRGFI